MKTTLRNAALAGKILNLAKGREEVGFHLVTGGPRHGQVNVTRMYGGGRPSVRFVTREEARKLWVDLRGKGFAVEVF